MNNLKPEKVSLPPSQKFTKKVTLEDNHESFVKNQVTERVGKIDDLKMIRAKNVFDNNWRVDIWCETKTEGCIVPKLDIRYSYFIRADKEGNIINSSPELGVESN
tara:strand:+ start:928 stop:1242 length:315 start_codon:yes stop_codon:yes gene_type:complete